MTGLDHASVFAAIQDRLHSPEPVADRMAAVVAVCERSVPHADWADLRELAYNDSAPMRTWLLRLLDGEPPARPLAGFWFGMYNPIRGGEVTADVRLGGSTRFTSDGELEWAYRLEYRPLAASAHSAVLRAIYSLAYGGGTDRLGNTAEWSLCLAYTAFAVQRLLSEVEPARVLRGSESIGVAVGFDSGDFLLVGRLLRSGLVPVGAAHDGEP